MKLNLKEKLKPKEKRIKNVKFHLFYNEAIYGLEFYFLKLDIDFINVYFYLYGNNAI